jgi:hypothetical protein
MLTGAQRARPTACGRRAHGVSNFLFDPDLDAGHSPAAWNSETNPSVVVLLAARDADPAHHLRIAGRRIIADHSDDSGRSLVLEGPRRRHRVRILTPPLEGWSGHALITDDWVPTRLAALAAYHRLETTDAQTAPSRLLRPTVYQGRRLALLLAILDRLAAPVRPTTRLLARELVYPRLETMRSAEWKSSTQRRQVQRLVTEARAMSRGGFQDLLRPPPQIRPRGDVTRDT